MELSLSPATISKLNEMAQRTGRGADELIDEAVEHLAAYNEWLVAKIKPRLEALERGEATVPDEEVVAWLEEREERERRERS